MPLGELGQRMSASEFQLRLVFAGEYGLADAFFATGQICTTVARSMSGANVSPVDFVPFYGASVRKPTAAERAAAFRARIDAARAAYRPPPPPSPHPLPLPG
jgi:hypothetical protein